jgi:hypothetical protein
MTTSTTDQLIDEVEDSDFVPGVEMCRHGIYGVRCKRGANSPTTQVTDVWMWRQENGPLLLFTHL